MADIKVSLQVLLEGDGIKNTTNALTGLASAASKNFGSSVASTDELIKAFKNLDSSVLKLNDSLSKTPKIPVPKVPTPPVPEIEKYAKAQGSANSAAMEFSRIVQDAPFGIRGMANNITQLTQSLASASTQAGGFGAGLKATFSSLLSPMNLVVLGISAVTSAMVYFGDKAQKNAKQIRENKGAFDEYIGTLEGVREASMRGEADAQKEIARAGVLFRAVSDVTLSLGDRKDAVKALQLEFPSYFKNLSEEQLLAGEGALAYTNLTKSLIATAKARAYSNKIAENSLKILSIEGKALDANRKIAEGIAEEARQQALIDSGKTADRTFFGESLNTKQARDQIKEGQSEINALSKELSATLAENLDYETRITEQIQGGADILKTTKSAGRAAKEEVVGLAGSMKLLNDTKAKIEAKMLLAVDSSEVEKLSKQLLDVNLEIFKLTSKQHVIKMKAQIDKFGVPELSNIEADVKLLGSGTDRPVNGKEEEKRVNKLIKDRYAEETKMAKDWLKTKNQLDKGFEKERERAQKDFNRLLGRGIESAVNSMTGMITSINELKDKDFGSVFSHIANGLVGSMDSLFNKFISDNIKKKLIGSLDEGADGVKSSLDSGASKLLVAAGAMSMAGSILQGIFPKTSIAGQSAGGALKGAASGAVVGTALGGPIIGTVIGGIVGAIGGLFGASKAKKEEKIRKQQLEEAKKQTALMERQNAMSFLQNIVGRMIEGVGVINSADISFDGKLVTKVSGKDLQFILDREEKSNKRL